MADLAVVDIEVSKTRTAVPSETTGTRKGFRGQLLDRDICFILIGIEAQGADSGILR